MASPSVITRRVIERVAERRIQEAQRAGAFDNLPGSGRPLPGLEEPYDPMWWVRKWLKRERLKAGLLAALDHREGLARALVLRELTAER